MSLTDGKNNNQDTEDEEHLLLTHCSVRTRQTEDDILPVWPSRSVNKKYYHSRTGTVVECKNVFVDRLKKYIQITSWERCAYGIYARVGDESEKSNESESSADESDF